MKKLYALLCAVIIVLNASAFSSTFYTTGGTFYLYGSSGIEDATSDMPSVEVTVNGNTVTITGLSYYFEDGAITGTMSGNTITFPSGQLVGTDDEGDVYLMGSNDWETICDIVFTYDPAANTLTANTAYIMENESTIAPSPFSYWDHVVFSAAQPAVEPSDMTFDFQLTDSSVIVLPSNDEDPWDYAILTQAQLDQYYAGDIDSLAALMYANYGDENAYPAAYEIGFSIMRDNGYTAGEYILVVWGANGGVTTPADSITFILPAEEVVPGTGIEDIKAAGKAVKVLRKGQFTIEKGSKVFNSLGSQLK